MEFIKKNTLYNMHKTKKIGHVEALNRKQSWEGWNKLIEKNLSIAKASQKYFRICSKFSISYLLVKLWERIFQIRNWVKEGLKHPFSIDIDHQSKGIATLNQHDRPCTYKSLTPDTASFRIDVDEVFFLWLSVSDVFLS